MIKKVRLLLNFIVVYSLSATVVLACSGARTDVLIEHNYSLVRLYGGISTALLFVSVVLFFLRERKGLWVVIITSLLLILHPVWTYGGGGGDCGRSKAGSALVLTVLVAVGTASQLRSWSIARSR
jgi:hypothetical protein